MTEATLTGQDILFRGQGLLGINKPAGTPVHGSRILEDQPQTLLSQVRNLEGYMVHAIHRLDRPVSGVMLMTGDRNRLKELGQAFENRKIRKCYLAVARGWTPAQGTISHDLLPPKDERKAGSVAREAVTHFEQIARVETPHAVKPYSSSRYSLLALYPETGRRHQLRRHLKHISHHLAGDTTYGRGEHNRLFREVFACHRLLLHAWSLEFLEPQTEEPVRIEAPLDQEFSRMVEIFGWNETLSGWNTERQQTLKERW
jgi:tRNA pseudouridine65 synthase